MTNEELKVRIGSNIARLRRNCHMTQAELAEKLNYSDKAVSKWERAESMPDVLTLMQLAEQFGTDVNALLSDPEGAEAHLEAGLPTEPRREKTEEAAPAEPQPRKKKIIRTTDKNVIQKLSSILVWVIALFIYLVLDSFEVQHAWMVFVLAVLANAIVLLSLRAAWKMYGINRILISIIMWTSLVFFYLMIWLIWNVSVWRVFLLGVLGQAAIMLWFKLFRYSEVDDDEEENHGQA